MAGQKEHRRVDLKVGYLVGWMVGSKVEKKADKCFVKKVQVMVDKSVGKRVEWTAVLSLA